MPIRIAFWNINTGTGSFADRILTFQQWCQAVVLDLLLLEEVSSTIREDLPGWTGLTEVGSVATVDRNFKPGTKELWALQSATAKAKWNFGATVLRLTELKSKRSLLKVTMKIHDPAYGNFALWVIHANASPSGGAAAVRAVQAHLENNRDTVVGGDFNCSIGNAGPDAAAPLSWQPNTNLNFTQWNKSDGSTRGPDAHLHLVTPPPVQPVMYAKIKPSPHGVIDYVMLGRNRLALPLANCIDEAVWRDILKSFDHCPVLYNLY
jgi:endonuclease/exonuclease/phosphatase family metal-dependent hydrolase